MTPKVCSNVGHGFLTHASMYLRVGMCSFRSFKEKKFGLRAAGKGGGGVMGWVIGIIFDPNTRHWGAGGGFMG